MIKERNEMLEKFKQWFTISSTDFETDPINQKIFFIDYCRAGRQKRILKDGICRLCLLVLRTVYPSFLFGI